MSPRGSSLILLGRRESGRVMSGLISNGPRRRRSRCFTVGTRVTLGTRPASSPSATCRCDHSLRLPRSYLPARSRWPGPAFTPCRGGRGDSHRRVECGQMATHTGAHTHAHPPHRCGRMAPCTHMYTYMHMCTHTHVYTHIPHGRGHTAPIHIYTCTHMSVHTWTQHVCTRECAHRHSRERRLPQVQLGRDRPAC